MFLKILLNFIFFNFLFNLNYLFHQITSLNLNFEILNSTINCLFIEALISFLIYYFPILTLHLKFKFLKLKYFFNL